LNISVKRQIYQIAESIFFNSIIELKKIDSLARIESNLNFFARIGMLKLIELDFLSHLFHTTRD